MKDGPNNCFSLLSDGTGRIVSLLFVLFISFILFYLYLQLSSHSFLNLDDPIYVVSNPHVTSGLSLENLVWAFKTFRAEFWHPLTWISYMTDTSIFGVRPGGYLFTNLLLHILNTVLLFYAMRIMTKQIWASALVATLFAVHPLHVETVAWIAERKELLSAFFFMLCIHSYILYVGKKTIFSYILLCVLFIAGIMSKPMIITLPFVLLLFDLWPLERISFDRLFTKNILPLIIEKIPLLILSAAGALITLVAQGQGGGMVPEAEYPFTARLANAIQAYAGYLKKTLWPVDLAVFYPFPSSIHILTLIFYAALLVFITYAFLIARRRYPFLIVGWLMYLGMLFPVIGLVKIGDFSMADRFTYLPLTGIFIILAFGTKAAVYRFKARGIIYILVFTVLVLSFFKTSFIQIDYWKDSESLYLHALDVTDENFFVHYGLGNLYAESGFTDNAINQFLAAVAIRPDKVSLWNALGRAFVLKNLWVRAGKAFQQGIKRKPDEPKSYYLLGCVMVEQKKFNRALFCFSRSFSLYLRSKGCHVDIDTAKECSLDAVSGHADVDNIGGRLEGRSTCSESRLIILSSQSMARNGPVEALSFYGIPVDKELLQKMILSGFENWPLIRKTNQSG